MQNNSLTAAGHSSTTPQQDRRLALIDAINQVFTLFRLNYHNQYLKAFGNSEELAEVKRLWLEMLQKFEPNTVLNAAKAVIESSEYLPTLRTMIYHCERASQNFCFPDAHSAYQEACRAPSPKAGHKWSHPVVYHAGRKCDWYFLQTNAESVAYPIFRKIYQDLCQEVREGKPLEQPEPPSLDHDPGEPVSREVGKQRLNALRENLNL